eukprot:5442429-Pleurochrysis_carterae.AAC.3
MVKGSRRSTDAQTHAGIGSCRRDGLTCIAPASCDSWPAKQSTQPCEQTVYVTDSITNIRMGVNTRPRIRAVITIKTESLLRASVRLRISGTSGTASLCKCEARSPVRKRSWALGKRRLARMALSHTTTHTYIACVLTFVCAVGRVRACVRAGELVLSRYAPPQNAYMHRQDRVAASAEHTELTSSMAEMCGVHPEACKEYNQLMN